MILRPVLVVGCLALVAGVALGDEAPRGDAADALRVARESRAHWTLGEPRARSRHGESRVEVELLADGRAVARLRLDPETGAFLARDTRIAAPAAIDLGRLGAAAARALPRVEVGAWAWPTEHGRAWRVPLQYQGRVIGTIKVDPRRGRLLGRDEDDD